MLRPKSNSMFSLALLIAISYPLSCWATGASFTGTVRDIGAADSAHNGISGVWIMVKDLGDKEIGSGLSDAQGAYKIEIRTPAREGLTAFYEKLGFQPRPTVRKVTDFNKNQRPVFMVKESATDEYYQTVATRIVDRKGLEQIQEGADILVSLPEAEKSRVLDYLKKAGAANVLNNVQTAEKWRMIQWKVVAELKSDEELSGRPIRVSSDSKVTGSFRLDGIVNSPGEKARAERIVRSVPGVRDVENALVIKK